MNASSYSFKKKKDRRNLDFSDYKKYFSIPTINYFTTNFNLGTKRGGVGDSSH
jgi:hypothetical protein